MSADEQPTTPAERLPTAALKPPPRPERPLKGDLPEGVVWLYGRRRKPLQPPVDRADVVRVIVSALLADMTSAKKRRIVRTLRDFADQHPGDGAIELARQIVSAAPTRGKGAR